MSDTAPRPTQPYSPMVRAGDWLVVSGQLGMVDGVIVDGGVAAQATQSVANIVALLATEGAAATDVVKTTVFLADIADLAVLNEAYMAAFGDHRPARSTFAVAGLPFGGAVEIEAWAYAPR